MEILPIKKLNSKDHRRVLDFLFCYFFSLIILWLLHFIFVFIENYFTFVEYFFIFYHFIIRNDYFLESFEAIDWPIRC